MTLISRAGEIMGLPRRTYQHWRAQRQTTNQQEARSKFEADKALFEQSGIYEALDLALAEAPFLKTIKQLIPEVMAVPPIWKPTEYSPERTLFTSPSFSAVVKWNHTTHIGMEMGFGDYYPVKTWEQLYFVPDSAKQEIRVEGLKQFEPLKPHDWQNPDVLSNALRWLRERPSLRGMPALDFGIGHNASSPHYQGMRLHPRFVPGGYFNPSHIL